jgi:hypothetical protein
MEWLNDIKDKFSQRRIRNLDRNKDFSRDFVDLDSAKKVGVLVNMSHCTEEDLTLLRNYFDALKKRGKELLVIELNFDKKSESTLSPKEKTIFLNPAKLNWLDYPTPSLENEIRKQELDILMDFDDTPRKASKYVCSIAHARTRVGVYREGFESCYELMISREEGEGMKSMIKEFDYFLNMIDNGKRVKVKT